MTFWNTTVRSALTLIVALSALFANSQVTLNNPYTRFGIGQLSGTGSARLFGMGGLTAVTYDGIKTDGSTINFNNPATYSLLTQPVFQLGVKGSQSTLESASSTSTYRVGQFNDLGLGFKQEGSKWGFAMGMNAYSSAGYNLQSSSALNDSIDVAYNYRGDGGLNKIVFGAARSFLFTPDTSKVSSHVLSIGVNMNYFFGSLAQTRRVAYSNSTFFSTRETNRASINDISFEIGVHYVMPFGETFEKKKAITGKYLSLGIDYQMGSNLRGNNSQIGESYFSTSGVESVIDTTYNTGLVRTYYYIPQRINAGAGLFILAPKGRTIFFGAEFTTQDWSQYKMTQNDTSFAYGELVNFQQIAAGIEFTPSDVAKAQNFFSRLQYRAGFRMTDSYLELRDTRIQTTAVSAGITIPLLATRTSYSGRRNKVHIGFEYAMSGTTDNGLLKEDVLTVQLGFSFIPFEQWFRRAKYD